MKLNRSECAVLPLVLKGKWFDMIDHCVDTGSLRDQIQKAVVSTVAIVEAKGGAK